MSDGGPSPGGIADRRVQAKQPRRFAAGIAIGAAATLLVLVIAGVVVYLTAFRTTDEEPWLKMTDTQHGTVAGWSDGTVSSGSPGPNGAIGSFSLWAAAEQDGIRVARTVLILVTLDTKLLLGGQPWTPVGPGDITPVERLFGGFEFDDGFDYLVRRELTVQFRREGEDLIAESIDAAATQQDTPLDWLWSS